MLFGRSKVGVGLHYFATIMVAIGRELGEWGVNNYLETKQIRL